MGVFKNSVGRPTNKVIKTRRIAKLSIVFAVVAIVALTTGVLTTISTKKVKGKASDYDYASTHNIKTTISSKNILKRYGGYFENADVDLYEVYNTSDEGIKKVNFTITNKNKFKIYYKIVDANNKELKTGSLLGRVGYVASSFKINVEQLKEDGFNKYNYAMFKYYKSKDDMKNDKNTYSAYRMEFRVDKATYSGCGINVDIVAERLSMSSSFGMESNGSRVCEEFAGVYYTVPSYLFLGNSEINNKFKYTISNENKFNLYYKITLNHYDVTTNNSNAIKTLKSGLLLKNVGKVKNSIKVNLKKPSEITEKQDFISIDFYKTKNDMKKGTNLFNSYIIDFVSDNQNIQ